MSEHENRELSPRPRRSRPAGLRPAGVLLALSGAAALALASGATAGGAGTPAVTAVAAIGERVAGKSVAGKRVAGETAAEPAAAGDLRPAAAFAAVEDDDARAVALFLEAAKVLLHPRCVNCHPAGDRPLQGEEAALHQPPVTRGGDGFGAVGMRCATCHQEETFDPGLVPGAPHWHLAPREMAWEGLSVRQVCEQLKDPARNGDRSLDAIVQHMKEDPLVAWGWAPGTGRQPAPGDQQTFGSLIAAWAEAGAACPGG